MNAKKFEGCQIPCLPNVSEGVLLFESQSLVHTLKRVLAKPWNYSVKKWLKRIYAFGERNIQKPQPVNVSAVKSTTPQTIHLGPGDIVRVKTRDEIESTLNVWKELKGCAFLEYMWEYCGTQQQVFKVMERFLDERDYKVKKSKGIVLLTGIYCPGTPVFGRCDRSCFLFWREEWLEKVSN